MKEFNLEKFELLIGQWEGIQGSGIYHEEWNKSDKNELKGKAYMIKKGEILNTEILKIHEDSIGIFYTADVSHNTAPVSFKLTFQNENSFVFENPEHDFPKKITYEFENNNKLKATVEASNNGKIKKIEYNLRRIV